MKNILVLSTNSSDAKQLVLWGLREAGHRCLAMGNFSKNEELAHSPLIRKFYPVPEAYTFEGRSAEIVPLIKKVVSENDVDVILPSGFESVKFLSQFENELKTLKPCAPVPSLEAIEQVSDKHLFATFCNTHGIPHPKTYLLEDLNAVLEDRLPVGYPLLTKPLRMSAGRGIFTFQNKEDLAKYLKSSKEDGSNALPLLLQEFIPGTDIDLNGFARQGHLSAWTIQRFIEVPRKKNKPLRWLQFLRNDDILKYGKKIVAETKYSGPIHIDMRIDERDGRVVTIEVNPRFWATTFASLCDGVNFADVAVQSAFHADYTKEPVYANRIWGTPHRIPLLLLTERDVKYLEYGRKHTFLQVKHRIMDRLFAEISNYRRKRSNNKGYLSWD